MITNYRQYNPTFCNLAHVSYCWLQDSVFQCKFAGNIVEWTYFTLPACEMVVLDKSVIMLQPKAPPINCYYCLFIHCTLWWLHLTLNLISTGDKLCNNNTLAQMKLKKMWITSTNLYNDNKRNMIRMGITVGRIVMVISTIILIIYRREQTIYDVIKYDMIKVIGWTHFTSPSISKYNLCFRVLPHHQTQSAPGRAACEYMPAKPKLWATEEMQEGEVKREEGEHVWVFVQKGLTKKERKTLAAVAKATISLPSPL